MLTRYVLPGEKVELRTLEHSILGSGPEARAYLTRVYDVLSDEQFELLMPMEGTKLILLPVNGEYNVTFYTKGGLYQCDILIVDRYKSGNNAILLCEPSSNLRKYQRREYYRFSCILDMNSRELVEEEADAVRNRQNSLLEGLPLRKGIIVDISGGGIRFVMDYKYEKGTLIYLTCNLRTKGEEKTYNIVGRILAVKPIANKTGEYEHRLQYLNMNSAEREEIIRYIFEEERKNRQKNNV